MCNPSICENSKNDTHQKLMAILENELLNNKFKIVKNKSQADFEIKIVSAFEGKIDKERPRNIYFFLYDNSGKELAQFGIAEEFSEPLTSKFVDMFNLESKFKIQFAQSIKRFPISVISESR